MQAHYFFDKLMNIFYLARSPKDCARYHCDKHVVKMIVEYCQMLSTAIRITHGRQVKHGNRTLHLLDGERVKRDGTVKYDPSVYLVTHPNHPSAVWVRQSVANYKWLRELALELCAEYTRRYGKIHATQHKLESLPVPKLPKLPFTTPPKVMPDNVQRTSVIAAYRQFYIVHKSRFAKWAYSAVPKWYVLD